MISLYLAFLFAMLTAEAWVQANGRCSSRHGGSSFASRVEGPQSDGEDEHCSQHVSHRSMLEASKEGSESRNSGISPCRSTASEWDPLAAQCASLEADLQGMVRFVPKPFILPHSLCRVPMQKQPSSLNRLMCGLL